MKKIGLTGNMGSGKTFASQIMKQYGIAVLDMDAVARLIRTQEENAILHLLKLESASQIATCVFLDTSKKALLEQFLYPKMIAVMNAFFEEHQNQLICVVEVPLLFEKKWDCYFDEVWCVTCDQKVAVDRLMRYRGINQSEALERLQHQMNAKEKSELSDFVLYNNEGDSLQRQIEQRLKQEGYCVKD